ncbi:Mitoferrin [Arthrobotrys entomopaga]|nr:Mitoferrin [Arthrobotrys entomopaga]
MNGGVTTTGSVNIHNPSAAAAYTSPPSSSSVVSSSSIDHHYHHHHHSDERFNFSPDHEPHQQNLPIHSSDTDMPGRRSGFVDVPASQRMLAACSGSLLTSLIVTPLDVVRVRLQAQAHPLSSPPTTTTTQSTSTLRGHQLPNQSFGFASTAHISRPNIAADLGVTSCCREVFWVSSTNELCLAYPNIPGSSSLTKSTESCLIESAASHRFTGTWEGLVKIARNEGLPSLYRGLSPTLLMSIPANVIYFTGYESLRYSNKSPISKLSDNMAPLIAGSLARTIAATVIAPLELFKTRLQAASHPKGAAVGEAAGDGVSAFRQTIMSVRSMVAHEGVTSLWRGLMLTLWRDVPFSGIYWWGYETVRGFLASERYGRKHHLGPIERHRVDNETLSQEEDKATFTDSFVAGATSGAVAAFVTTPFDVGKTRRQVWRAAGDVAGDANTATVMKSEGSMPKVLMEIYKTEGIRGLFRGCVPRMLKVAPACAIMISSYEIGKKYAMRMKEKEARDGAQ